MINLSKDTTWYKWKVFIKKYFVICCESVFVVEMLSSKHVQNDLCTSLRVVFGQCVDLKKIRSETTSKYFFLHIYKIYREFWRFFFNTFELKNYNRTGCRNQSNCRKFSNICSTSEKKNQYSIIDWLKC